MQIGKTPEQNIGPIRYCLYARKSSESDERQAMSIDSQIKEMAELAKKENLTVREVRQESHSAKESGQRPVFVQLLSDIRNGQFNGILTWAPDRLSRNAGDLGMLVDLMDQEKLFQIRTFSQVFSNNPNEKFLLMILCSQAKLENDNRGINVKRGIRAKCEMGWRPGVAPLGYMNRAFGGNKDIIIDSDRAPIVQEMFHRVAEFGQSGRTLKKWLDRIGLTTKNQKKLTLSMIYYTLKNSFYYGKFKYGDKWYTGSHKPLISEEIFNKVQKQLVVPRKSKWGSKGFAFKNCFKCATCNANLVGEEKYRRRLDGSVCHHIYYHCSRQVDYNCRERYISEEELVRQLVKIISSEEFKSTAVSEKIRGMYESYRKITREVLIQTNLGDKNTRVTLKSFGIYVLRNGLNKEKADFIQGLPMKFYLHNKQLQTKNHYENIKLV
jgi:site-specific DNA recombinase